MLVSRDAEAVAARIAALEAQLQQINDAIAGQMAQPYMSRKRELCSFLILEREVFTARLLEIKWMLNA
ncbi:hypothetical protein [Paraflavitalea pollutisoli]|uniref:hypothetical protein n=1 Tax=Paraflavitalea pollutisoli TaxID=3034143 RepID=UPI0023EA80A7|nr:hypothetical protein [Paraflavitalea sp. H1-2-19X]